MNKTESGKRLIEIAFPLEQVSLDSVHEKNVRHGHISTLHIWPARRPLAASRAALIATLLPDPGNQDEHKAIYRRLAGELVENVEQKNVGGRKVEKSKRETRGGILHWGLESGPDIDWFRDRIRQAYDGRAPKVLDPFAGGGAIPLEAMRLGCDVTAIDINPVAWFILKCTLEYPQNLSGETRPVPDFALKDREFMEPFLKTKGFKGAALVRQLKKLGFKIDGQALELDLIADDPLLEADLAWQVRAWGRWVLAEVRKKLGSRYPTYAEFDALKHGGKPFAPRPLTLLKSDANGETDVTPLNASFDKAYLDDPRNPRWVAKPTLAYLWTRTVRCKGCRATIPLLKTRWLAKKDHKRILLTVAPNADRTAVVFGIERNVPFVGGNAAQRREQDRRRGAGTMSRSGAQCQCCPTVMSQEDIRLEALAGRLGRQLYAIIVEGISGKEYREPTDYEISVAGFAQDELEEIFSSIPFGLPEEPISPLRPSPNTRGASGLPRYAIDKWRKVFSPRQQAMLGHFIRDTRRVLEAALGYVGLEFSRALVAYLAACVSRLADRGSEITTWQTNAEKLGHTFARYVIPFTTDFAESNPFADSSGGFIQAIDWVAKVVEHCLAAAAGAEHPHCFAASAISAEFPQVDLVITDPPYYDAIPYSDIMDFFHVWLRRTVFDIDEQYSRAFADSLGPKWNVKDGDGELVDQPGRFASDTVSSKAAYENGMAAVFAKCLAALKPDGRLILVFANKNPNAWETLVSALVRAGFLVDGSWPIQTERGARMNAITTASLASSVWLVCKKRPVARPGWDTAVLAEMRDRIHTQLRAFWDAGIRGPDFVWAATGPALEAFSKYPVIKKADEPNAQMSVSEFLREVRRIVVDFVVGRVLTHNGDDDTTSGLDDITTYYLLHRHDFGLAEAPIGACILYALSCNLSDGDLADRFDILARSGRTLLDELQDSDEEADPEGADTAEDEAGGGGSKVKLKAWDQRRAKWLGFEGPGGRPAPLIDQAHRLMHLWRAGDEAKVNDYLDTRGLKRNALFSQLLQALIELSPAGSEERSILESLSNHIVARGGITAPRQTALEV
jgi:putative DNA methylase